MLFNTSNVYILGEVLQITSKTEPKCKIRLCAYRQTDATSVKKLSHHSQSAIVAKTESTRMTENYQHATEYNQ
jgi:hypothetical protein